MHFKDILYSVLPLLAVTNANAAAIEAQQDLEARRVSKLVMRQVPVLPCSHLSNGVHVIAASVRPILRRPPALIYLTRCVSET